MLGLSETMHLDVWFQCLLVSIIKLVQIHLYCEAWHTQATAWISCSDTVPELCFILLRS